MAVGYTFGCSLRSLELKKVPSDFDVLITHQDKPIAGIRVQVVAQGTSTLPVIEALTNNLGVVHIVGLARGEYYLTASHLEFEAGKEWIEVVDAAAVDAKTVTRFDFQWADGSYEISHVAGILTGLVPGNTGSKLKDILNPVSVVYPGVEIKLKNAFSDEAYRVVSDSSGTFVFSPVKAGIYLLTIAGGEHSVTGIASETNLMLDVSPSSKRELLRLKLQDTGCYNTEFTLDTQN
jgi:hypothetical protein